MTDKARFEEIISGTCHSLYAIGILAYPVMPEKMATLLTSLGVDTEFKGNMIDELTNNPWTKVFMLHKIATLFQKYEAAA